MEKNKLNLKVVLEGQGFKPNFSVSQQYENYYTILKEKEPLVYLIVDK